MRKQIFQKAFGDSAYAALTRGRTDLFSTENSTNNWFILWP